MNELEMTRKIKHIRNKIRTQKMNFITGGIEEGVKFTQWKINGKSVYCVLKRTPFK